MQRPRILETDEAFNLMIAALGIVCAAAPDGVLIVGPDGLRNQGRIFIEVLETGAVCFSIDSGRRQ